MPSVPKGLNLPMHPMSLGYKLRALYAYCKKQPKVLRFLALPPNVHKPAIEFLVAALISPPLGVQIRRCRKHVIAIDCVANLPIDYRILLRFEGSQSPY